MEVDAEVAFSIVRNIGQLWLEGQFVDLQINIGGKVFNCSQLILCACSKFFKVLLKSEVKGEVEYPIRYLNIKGISAEIFQLILNALYKAEIGLNTENMVEFWYAVSQLEIPVLVSKCETFVSNHLTPENFIHIHLNAVSLKSVDVITAVQQFVAENFETFMELNILLQQPASFIESITRGTELSQDHFVKFILKWASYELCARDTEQVSADSAVEDLTTQRNEVTGNTYGSVEVVFEKPRVVSGDDCFRQPAREPSFRKQFLGKLLKLVRFKDVRKNILEVLADNDLVMGSKETRDIVRQAMGDTEDTVVFVARENSRTVCAYSLDRGEIFMFYNSKNRIFNMHSHHAKLLWGVLNNSESCDPFRIRMVEFPFTDSNLLTCPVRSDSVIVGDFCYTSRGGMCRRHIKDGEWYTLFSLPDHMPSPSLAVFKDSILYYNSTLGQHGKQEVYCFNTKSRKPWLLMTCDYQDCDFVTFIHEDQLYIVYSNGMFLNVTQFVTSPVKAFSLPKYSEIDKSRLLWDSQFKLYGAVVHNDSLIVFGDLSSISVSEINQSKIPGLKAMKFVHLYDLATKCHPLIIPKQRLTTRM